ncbi:hypothetical protein H696_00172 [Fonticula alba]|uniref:Uncharacterized protein n=1 Tax=Fonticula alba TaxID=691883 RepID=A0A058ZF48_FONAL|nr:hypothetical protein H696_00172 [Fonticula alba]KCV72581.1 hypothetical protein H696_00172 [Fonticula alba]|eukprot:XP_009492282.1 hypothetical protein H696_00172 [Fonticula alba]
MYLPQLTRYSPSAARPEVRHALANALRHATRHIPENLKLSDRARGFLAHDVRPHHVEKNFIMNRSSNTAIINFEHTLPVMARPRPIKRFTIEEDD